MAMRAPKLGVKMSADDAKVYIGEVNKKVIQRWQERVTHGPFMSTFLEGTLPLCGDQAVFQELGQLHRRDQYSGIRLLSQAYRLF